MTLRTAFLIATAALALWPAAGSAAPADTAAPTALRTTIDRALWPADIVRAADAYLATQPGAADAAEVTALRDRAAASAQALARRDLMLYRSAFAATDAGQTALLRRAALGDAEAALRLAAQTDAEPRRLGWLQYAAALGHDGANYELALHFRRSGQPLLAARYEEYALALGYRPAPSLDHVRK